MKICNKAFRLPNLKKQTYSCHPNNKRAGYQRNTFSVSGSRQCLYTYFVLANIKVAWLSFSFFISRQLSYSQAFTLKVPLQGILSAFSRHNSSICPKRMIALFQGFSQVNPANITIFMYRLRNDRLESFTRITAVGRSTNSSHSSGRLQWFTFKTAPLGQQAYTFKALRYKHYGNSLRLVREELTIKPTLLRHDAQEMT